MRLNAIGEEGKMRTMAVVLTVIVLVMAGTTVWAEESAVTIYFAGTSATHSWYNPSESSFGNPELLADLFNHAKPNNPRSIQAFVDGIGTGCGWSLLDILSKSNAEIELCRGWNTCLAEGDAILDSVLPDISGDVILNLVGWSRGGVLAMRFANRDSVYTNPRIKRINILAIDPAGHRTLGMETSVPAEEFCLNEKVKQYVGIYARDERSYMFGTAIPDGYAATDAWKFIVPGGHETVVGSDKKWKGSDESDPKLSAVSWVTKAVAKKLLGSSQWGNVEFDDPDSPWQEGLEYEAKKNEFIEKVNAMWTPSNYEGYYNIRKHGMTPIGFEAYGLRWKLLPWPPHWEEGCWWCDILDWLAFDEWEAPRCASRFTCLSGHTNVPLESEVPQLDGAYAWAKLEQLGNSPPVADAGPDRVVSSDGTCMAAVTLDGSGSSDIDGNPLQYMWTWASGLASDANPTISLGLGFHTITLTVSDGINTSTDTVNISVEDKTPPTITPPPAVTAYIDPGAVSCEKFVGASTLGTATASDNCSGAIPIQESGVPAGNIFSFGTTTITYTATDAAGNSATATQKVTVVDNTPPSLKVTLSPSLLWPPDHRMVTVTADIQTSDVCDPSPTVRLVSIVSNEPDNGLGDGDFPNDITGANTGTDDRVFNLRAERSGIGNGRVYTATYEATDHSGNSSSVSGKGEAPHRK